MAVDLFTYARQPRAPEPEFPADIPKEVCDLFENLALQVRARGFARYSSDAILHRIRWEYMVERGDRDFKCNDHWTAPLARWFLNRHPDLAHIRFFETRERRQPEKQP